MFVHQRQLLLFVAAALAVAMHMGTIIDAQAASVPLAYRRSALNAPPLVAPLDKGKRRQVWMKQRDNRQYAFDVQDDQATAQAATQGTYDPNAPVDTTTTTTADTDEPTSTATMSDNGPAATVTMADDGPAATATMADDGPTATATMADDGPAATATMADDGPTATATMADDGPTATATMPDEGPTATVTIPDDAPTATSTAGDDEPFPVMPGMPTATMADDGPVETVPSNGETAAHPAQTIPTYTEPVPTPKATSPVTTTEDASPTATMGDDGPTATNADDPDMPPLVNGGSGAKPTTTGTAPSGPSTASSPAATTTPTTTQTGSTGTATTKLPAASPVATVTTGAGTQLMLQSNTPGYGWTEAMADLNKILVWAGADGNLTEDEKTEVVAAILSGSARFWPEVPTRVMTRIMLADIRAESDFRPRVIGGERMGSGSSWGLTQISPAGSAQMLPLVQNHLNVGTHNFTWGIDAANVRAGVRGALIDWQSGQTINLAGLTATDLLRPWINIHAAMWIQSNHARTASNDPYWWQALNAYSWSLKQLKLTVLSAKQTTAYKAKLRGAGLSRSPRTALGSWVAGSATNGAGSYLSAGDDVSKPYLAAVMKSISFLYNGPNGAQWKPTWLEKWTVNAGLSDYV